MGKESVLNEKLGRGRKIFIGGVIVSVVLFFIMTAVVKSDGPSSSGPPAPGGPVQFEEIPGSPIKRVILTEKAAERLGIQMGKISEDKIYQKQIVGGRLVKPVTQTQKVGGSFGFGKVGFDLSRQEATVADSGPPSLSASGSWLEVVLTYGEWDRLKKDKPVKIFPLGTRDSKEGEGVLSAVPSGLEPYADIKRTMLTVYYKVEGDTSGFSLYDRVRVELQLLGDEAMEKVTPYSTVYYDAKGGAWVYTNPRPLVFERQAITIKRIDGDMALLSEGPSVGTPVVIAGAPLLYGAEVVFKK